MNRFPDTPVAQGKALLLFISVKGNEDLQHFTSYFYGGGGNVRILNHPVGNHFPFLIIN